jgi:DNA repair photolyase
MKFYRTYKQGLDTIFSPVFKIWSNGIPLKLDTYSSCANFCRFCYAEELRKAGLGRCGVVPDRRILRVLDMKRFLDFVDKSLRGHTRWPFMSWALRNKGYIELGTTGEAFQEIDLHTKITESFLRVASELELPLLINLKGNLLCRNEKYQKLIQDYKAPIIFFISFTTTDDKLGKLYEPLAPLPSERLKTFKEFSKLPHVWCVSYISPFMPGVTDLDTERYVTDLVENGVVGGHIRDFFLQGKTFQSGFWQNYIQKNAKDLEPFPGGHHVSYKARLKFMLNATKIGVKLNPSYRIVGMKTRFFDVDINWGKMMYDVLDDRFKSGVLDFSIIPLLRKIKKNNKPQLLFWNKMGYKKELIKYPPLIFSKEGGVDNLLTTYICINSSGLSFYLEGFDWIKRGIWNGFLKEPATGFISRVEGIYPVKHKGKFFMDGEDYVYAYIPKDRGDLVSGFGLMNLLISKGSFKPYVEYNVAKDFMVPERLGGTEDKWLKKEEIYAQSKILGNLQEEWGEIDGDNTHGGV